MKYVYKYNNYDWLQDVGYTKEELETMIFYQEMYLDFCGEIGKLGKKYFTKVRKIR